MNNYTDTLCKCSDCEDSRLFHTTSGKGKSSGVIPETVPETEMYIILGNDGNQPDYNRYDYGFQRSIIFNNCDEALKALGYFLQYYTEDTVRYQYKVYKINPVI